MNVTDLASACQTQTKQEVDKKFAEAASFMLRKVVSGEKGGKSSEHVKKGKRGDPKWDTKQFADGQYFS